MATASANKGNYGDLTRRPGVLLLALVVYRQARTFQVPGINPDRCSKLFEGQQGGILSLFNMFSGGALSRFTVFALGIMPYISASIIMQLMTYVGANPTAQKKAETGRRKSPNTHATAPWAWRFFSHWVLRWRSKARLAWCWTRALVSA